MLKQKKLTDLKVGDSVNHFLIISKFEIKTTKTNKEYLDLLLRDKSTMLPAKMWDNIKSVSSKFAEGSIVKVNGTIDKYQDQYQIKIDKLFELDKDEKVNLEDLLPVSYRNLSDMESELKERIDIINNVYLKQLIKSILSGSNYQLYISVPAGKAWHHAYLHGLLEHTLEIIKICDLMCDFHQELNRDLLISGAILHDYGKTEELSVSASFDYTDRGRLLGHIVIAAIEIEKAASEVFEFPVDLKDQLIHLVLSHQGKLEHASPVIPKTMEAIVLYHADELSAKANAYKYAIITDAQEETNWTRFLPLAGTALFKNLNVKGKDNFNESLFDN